MGKLLPKPSPKPKKQLVGANRLTSISLTRPKLAAYLVGRQQAGAYGHGMTEPHDKQLGASLLAIGKVGRARLKHKKSMNAAKSMRAAPRATAIHERRPPPILPEGEHIEDPTPSKSVSMQDGEE